MTAANKTILVIENSDVEREGLAVILRREGYAVALSAHGREALDFLNANPPPDLILLALLIPVMDGWEFLNELERLPKLASVPVVILTSSPVVGPDWAIAHNCAGILRKPIGTADLLALVRQCLDPSAGATGMKRNDRE